MKPKSYWIKQRFNPQLGVYYVACGQISVREAKRLERTLYGDNVMLRFSSEDEYNKKLSELRDSGEKIHST